MKSDLYYHFLNSNGMLRYDRSDVYAKPGLMPHIPNPVPRVRGWHGCKQATHALAYAPGPILDMRKLFGTVQHSGELSVASDCEIICVVDASKTLHEFALRCAEIALEFLQDPEEGIVEALEAKRQWMHNDLPLSELHRITRAAKVNFHELPDNTVWLSPEFAKHCAEGAILSATSVPAVSAAHESQIMLRHAAQIFGTLENTSKRYDFSDRLNAELERRLDKLAVGAIAKHASEFYGDQYKTQSGL